MSLFLGYSDNIFNFLFQTETENNLNQKNKIIFITLYFFFNI